MVFLLSVMKVEGIEIQIFQKHHILLKFSLMSLAELIGQLDIGGPSYFCLLSNGGHGCSDDGRGAYMPAKEI